jgi:signal peptidase II
MNQRIRHFLYVIILIAFDQLTKYFVRADLMNKEPFVIIPKVLSLQYHENTGAVWGFFSGGVSVLAVVTILILGVLIFFYSRIPNGKRYNALKIIFVFIMAGAVGNMIDRIFLKHVVDFIYFEIINFPLFNVADTYVTVSSFLLFFLALFYYKDKDFEFLDQLFKKKNTKINDGSQLNGSDENDDNK